MAIDITGLPVEQIDFAISPLAELGMALHVLAGANHHPGLDGWTTATTAGLEAELAGRLGEADFLWRRAYADVFQPFAGINKGPARPGATLAQELDLLDRLDDERFASAALEFAALPHLPQGEEASPLADATLRRRSLELAAAHGPRQLAFTHRLLTEPGQVRIWLRRLFEDCGEAFFDVTWERVRAPLAADARHKQDLLHRHGAAEALRAASKALSVDEDGTRIRIDKLVEDRTTAVDPDVGAGLTLMPTTFGWPHLMVLTAPGWRPVVHYPLSTPQLTPPAPVRLVQERLQALAHPVRMVLCRHLARTAHSTAELASLLGLTAPETSRHLSTLKKAELLTTRRRGRYVLHQLDTAAVARLGGEYLEGILR
ncbi:DUF5937 family protein [Streptomyces sp. NPDC001941]|uniref:DUF5937 family protein n=1 Tax=Streptomyces sp. NPDC001941 TaxID=3154659 RepID=UPI00331E36F2